MQDGAFLFADATDEPCLGAHAAMDIQNVVQTQYLGELYERLGSRKREKLYWTEHVRRKNP